MRVAASSSASAINPGLTRSGVERASASAGSTPAVMPVAAVGARQFTRTLRFSPSSVRVCTSPTKAIVAVP